MAKYQSYAEYKDSGVEWLGDVPQHWALVPCRAVVDHIVEKNSNNALDNYLSLMANIGVIKYEDKGDVGNKKPDDLSKCKIVRKGQLVINSMNYAIGSYGMSPYDGICSPVYIVLQAKKDVFLERFALRIFENTPFQKYLATFGNGILEHRAAINWEDIKNKYVPLPTLDEQKNILDFLDHETTKIDRLIEKQQQLIELLKEKRQAVISHAVTKGLDPNVPMKDSGVEWLGEVPEHWKVTRFKFLCDSIVAGPFGSSITKDMYVNQGFKVYGQEQVIPNNFEIGDYYISEKNYKELARYAVDPGDILISCVGTFGKIAVFPSNGEKGIINPRLIKATLSKDHNSYFYREFLKSEAVFKQFEQLSRGGTMGVINIAILNEIVAVAPDTNEQEAIYVFIAEQKIKFSHLIGRACEQIELLKERRTALISAAVTGKIDVRHWHAPTVAETQTELSA